ncbi:MAG: hypothetical protein RLZZ393_1643 [Pseudomonadota bacterium]|jgi:ABC-type uncharacterized transport system auxiliary subunit
MSLRFMVALPVLALLLSGCGGLRSRAEPEQLYVLQPPAAMPAGPRVEATLQVLRPVAQPGLDTSRIALLQPGNRLDHFDGGRWAGPLEQVAEALFVRALRGSGRFAHVASDGAAMGADFVLALTLRRFEVEYPSAGGLPVAHVVLECTLSSRREHRQLAGFDVVTQSPATANRLGPVVEAIERAAQDASRQLVAQSADIAGRAQDEVRKAPPAR